MCDQAELASDNIRGFVTRNKWGPWFLDRSTRTLCIEEPTEYSISLSNIDSAGQLLDWIYQLEAKSWVTEEVLGYFVRAAGEILRPQNRLCGGGVQRRNPAEPYLDSALGAGPTVAPERDEHVDEYGDD